jgi:phosphoglucosamine mutase
VSREEDSLFGTDGVRGRPGEGVLAEESIGHLARAIRAVLARRERYPEDIPAGRGNAVYMARDTRSSGPAICDLVAEGLLRGGYQVRDLGVLPTPGAAHVGSVNPECCLVIVISASHNPAEYNGIKLLAPSGAKMSSAFEDTVARLYHEGLDEPASSGLVGAAAVSDLSRAALDAYVGFLVESCKRPERLRGRRLVLDAANGAAFEAAPRVFRELGAEVVLIGDAPDGSNINLRCGALHPQPLAEKTFRDGAVAGFCFDGDADRMIPVTARGDVLDGDHVLALAGRHYRRHGLLPRSTVVATVMSNIGLERALHREGLRLLRTPVGDRNVYRELVAGGHPVGGEQSGHLIFMDFARTGDGILAAVRLLDFLEGEDLDLERESRILERYPQVLENVRVRERVPLESIPAIAAAVREAEAELGSEGRVLLRYSGTEPLARVMLEGPDLDRLRELCGRICEAIRASVPR